MAALHQVDKNSLKIKFLGEIFLGHHGATRRDIPAPGPGMSWAKTLCKEPFSVVLEFRQGMAGSRGLGQDVPGSEKLYARKHWADFFVPYYSYGTR